MAKAETMFTPRRAYGMNDVKLNNPEQNIVRQTCQFPFPLVSILRMYWTKLGRKEALKKLS